jgi:hypothetical protein
VAWAVAEALSACAPVKPMVVTTPARIQTLAASLPRQMSGNC